MAGSSVMFSQITDIKWDGLQCNIKYAKLSLSGIFRPAQPYLIKPRTPTS